MSSKLTTLADAVSLVEDGGSLGIASPAVNPLGLVPMATVREIVRQGRRDLTLFTAMGNIEADMLIGAGCIRDIDFWGCNLFGSGTPPNLRRAAEAGQIVAREQSEFSLTLAVLAGAMGVEFIPLHGYRNDHLQHHPEWRAFESPFDGEELVAIAAIVPDVAIIQVPKADEFGNAQLGETNRHNTMAKFTAPRLVQAAKRVILTAEEIVSNEEIRKTPDLTAILYHDVDAVVHLPRGAHPHGITDYYEPDMDHIKTYMEAAQSSETFGAYLEKYVHEPADHAAYLELADQG